MAELRCHFKDSSHWVGWLVDGGRKKRRLLGRPQYVHKDGYTYLRGYANANKTIMIWQGGEWRIDVGGALKPDVEVNREIKKWKIKTKRKM